MDMDEAQKTASLQAKGCMHLAQVVNGLRQQKGIDLGKEVKKAYKLMAAGRYEEPVMSVEAIVKKEFPDGAFPKPYMSAI
mmetsp:Transcript_47633/g.108079  ORF Transcript_47633/g.108079 Transcript_47633/m.108079 type:complete len:80 (-) Transcript_47633:76-315(-)